MSGGTLVWLTDDELAMILHWYDEVPEVADAAELQLAAKLDAKREEVACRVPAAKRTLARDV